MEIINNIMKTTDNSLFVECEDCGWDGMVGDLKVVIYGKKTTYICPECESTKVNSY